MTPEEAEQRIKAWWENLLRQINASVPVGPGRDTVREVLVFPAWGYIQAFVDIGYLPEGVADPLWLNLIRIAHTKPVSMAEFEERLFKKGAGAREAVQAQARIALERKKGGGERAGGLSDVRK